MAVILLIDDDAAVRRTINRMLASAGHTVVEAEDGKAGMAKLRSQPADIVITDILMPEQDGIETIRRIRETSGVPVIAISGSRTEGDVDVLGDAEALGADASLPKPVRKEQLLACIARLLLPPPTPPTPRR